MKKYDQSFYEKRHARTLYSARNVLSKVVWRLPALDSAVDLGCGVGTWLSVLNEYGAGDIQGIDAPWVDTTLLEVPSECFLPTNLEEKIRLDRRFDLAISLEVAEHLPACSASTFVETLTHLSDFVLFSAAIPHQGGREHINEQWPDYWAALFKEQGYRVLDFVRAEIWDDEQVLTCYRQNTLFYVREDRLAEVQLSETERSRQGMPLSVVHPRSFVKSRRRGASIKGNFRRLRSALMRKFRN
jgi:SAM-dependent methyltransferase